MASSVGTRSDHESGVRPEKEEESEDSTSDGDDGREALRSINGVRSVMVSVDGSIAVDGDVAVVSKVGAVLGARRGDRGGDVVFTGMRRE